MTVTAEQLELWLLENGFAESTPGYGHVSGARLAEALLERYELTERGQGEEG